MTRHRFFHHELTPGRIILSPNESAHASRVLRLRPGALVDLFDGRGATATGSIVAAGKSEVNVEVERVSAAAPPQAPSLTLVTAMPRAHRQQFLFEKCTELGVSRIIPTLFERSTVKPKADAVGKWQRITIEAAKQCGCVYLPDITRPENFEATLTPRMDTEAWLVASIGREGQPLGARMDDWSKASEVRIWIGPEGGMTDDEESAARSAGAAPVSLGPNILRIETAVLAVAAVFASAHR